VDAQPKPPKAPKAKRGFASVEADELKGLLEDAKSIGPSTGRGSKRQAAMNSGLGRASGAGASSSAAAAAAAKDDGNNSEAEFEF